MHHALKPDAQGFDEVRIVTVPRFKESELSGDEWRISARVELWRKGRKIHEEGWGRNVEAALMAVGYLWLKAIDDGKAMFAGEDGLCDQEGCGNPATVTYILKKGFNRDGSKRRLFSTGEYRQFCDRHKHRGDCGLEDADNNYEPVPAGAKQA
jgi:hypothetical protein